MFARGRNLGFGCASATPVGEVCSADLEWDVRACGAVRADDGETTPAAEDQVAAVRRPVDRVHEPLREPPLVRAVRVELKAIVVPSGDQLGNPSVAGEVVRRRMCDPSASITKMSYCRPSAATWLMKAIRRPSGDQAGYSTWIPGLTRCSRLPSGRTRPRSKPPNLAFRAAFQAIQSPRGDQAGPQSAVSSFPLTSWAALPSAAAT